jgi:hypothetical protein
MNALPPVSPAVVAEVLDGLPPRLRKRLDAALPKAAEWAVVLDGDTATARLDEDTTLTWTLHGGVLTAAGDLGCGCLLAPNCLHRGIAVAAAEVGEAAEDDAAVPAAAEAEGVPAPQGEEVTAGQRDAAGVLWSAAGAVLLAGAAGSGAVVQAELLRAVHTARVHGLHRAAAAGLRIVAALRGSRAGDSSFDRAELSADLTELLLLCHDLRTGRGNPAELRGTARREYRPVGGLRLWGLCTEAVVTTSGYAGVVTHLVDDRGGLWTVPAIAPGGEERVGSAAGGPVAVGESGLTHRALGRAGLVLSGATASPDRRLGAGAAVRAVAASGARWSDEPLDLLWRELLTEQVRRAFAALARPPSHRPAGADLLFLDAEIAGVAGDALRVLAGGAEIDLVGGSARVWENLRLLARSRGARVRVVARLVPDRPATAEALAVAAEPDELSLPQEWRQRADLGLDRLQRSHLTGDRPVGRMPPRSSGSDGAARPVRLLEHWVQRVVVGGRSVPAVASAAADRAALARWGLTGTAALLAELEAAARDHERDAFGRIVSDSGDPFVLAWLRSSVHVAEFTRTSAQRTWLEPEVSAQV